MFFVFIRWFLKLFFFFFLLFFVVFYVTLGYRFDPNVGIVKKNRVVSLYFWADSWVVDVNWKLLNFYDGNLNVYGLNKWCYTVKYRKQEIKLCLNKNAFVEAPIIGESFFNCKKIKKLYFGVYESVNFSDYEDKFNFFQNIRNVFRCKDFWFIVLNNKILYCDKDFNICHNLIDFSWWYILGCNKYGLVVVKDSRLCQLYLK